MKIDVIIPTYKPDDKLKKIFHMLAVQTVKVHKIIIMNTEEKYLNHQFSQGAYEEVAPIVEIHHITQEEFDHGFTRNEGASYSQADVLVYMTQDAVPQDTHLLEELIKPFSDETVAVSYARQVPDVNSSLAECFARVFNYPDRDELKSAEDLKRLGIKTYFCSNVCAAYRKPLFEEYGGFVKSTIFNEDMIFAAGVIKHGKKIAYASGAIVVHAHNYTNRQQFKRNFDLAVSQAMHPEVFAGISSESEGIKYVCAAFRYFKERGKGHLILPFVITCGWKYMGFRLGKNYDRLSRRRILKYTMSPRYFKKMWNN
ncbi:MAG: glycosyltransferase family 2 protein [Lachnospiraceae bacterium]